MRGASILLVAVIVICVLIPGCNPPRHPPHTPQPVPDVPRP
jgi:hypothetical protein